MLPTENPNVHGKRMRSIRSRDTKPELSLRRTLHAKGYRFLTHLTELPGTPDVVFSRRKIALFVHGCFWHGHGCQNSKIPTANRRYWIDKIAKNRARDSRVRKQLEMADWSVLEVWECEIKRSAIERVFVALGPPRIDTYYRR